MAQQLVKSDQNDIGFKTVRIFKDQTLGIGSFGAVYKAKCDDLLCAAKILHPTLFDPSAQQQVAPRREHRLPIRRFEQECEFTGAIKHPNIVQFLGMESDPDTRLPVLLMELMDDSLTHYLETSTQPIPYHIQVSICHDITLALSFLHSNKIIHRDLSSNNVLLTGSIRAKVTDFGMAKLYDSLNCEARTRLTLTMCPGTDVFMPPEAVKDDPVYTEKIDCFSFGVLIIQILTQKYPKPGNRQKEVELSYPGLPTGKVMINVPEINRRQTHISEIDSNHPLLPIALECLNDEAGKRPSAHQLCKKFETLKQSSRYTESCGIPDRETLHMSTRQHTSEVQNLQIPKQRKNLKADETQQVQDSTEHDTSFPDVEKEMAEVTLQSSPDSHGNPKPQPKSGTSFRKKQHAYGAAEHTSAERDMKQGKKLTREQPVVEASRTNAVIQFFLHHDVMHSKLTVRLQCASNLPREHDQNGFLQCDSFVTLHLEPDRGDTLRSKVVKGTCDPTFDQSFLFVGFSVDEIKHQTLVLQIYNKALNNKVIGEASLPLADVELFGVVMQMFIRTKEIKGHRNKNSGSEGDLLVSLSYSPLSCKLGGIIHKATGLRKCDRFGLSDPFVKMRIIVRNKRMFNWRTSVKHKTLAPEYNESFSYEVTDDMRMSLDIENVMISLDIFNHDRFKPNDRMGCVSIGKHASTELGRRHWAEVLKSPQQRISYWHPIQLPTEAQSIT